jgi:hypothetical protein
VDFVAQLLRALGFIPAVVTGIEGLFASKPGPDKKDAVMSFVQTALSMADAVANKDIVDQEKFKNGIEQVINGAVECLNASAWTKPKQS